MSASEARRQLYSLIHTVNRDCTAMRITSEKGVAVPLSEDEFDAMQETLHLLRSLPTRPGWRKASREWDRAM